MSRWKRPPANYDEDEEANADGYFLFNLLDRDQNAYLDIKEIIRARRLILQSLAGDNVLTDAIDGIMNGSDENNDGKVIEEEWHDFMRSIYEIAGRRRWKEITRSYRKSILAANEKLEEVRKASKEAAAQKTGRRKSKSGQRKPMTEEQAATKIQARIRGRQTRKSVRKAPQCRDPEKVQLANSAGRHFVNVISQAAEYGARADFYVDGIEIQFDKTHGDFGRGLQAVFIDPGTGEVVKRGVYDIVKPNVRSECARLASDIAELPEGYFVLVANKGYGLRDLNSGAVAALRSVGATFDGLGKREESYALIGCKGCLASAETTELGTADAQAAVSYAAEDRAIQIVGAMPRDLAP